MKNILKSLIKPSAKAIMAMIGIGISTDRYCVIECETKGCKHYLIFETFDQKIIMKGLELFKWNVKYNGEENKMYTYYCPICTEKEINVKEKYCLQKEETT